MNIIEYKNSSICFLFFIGNIIVNALISNKVGKVSKRVENGFSIYPADFTFSIWGLIYITQFIYLVCCYFKKSLQLVKNSTLLFSSICILNSIWLFSWVNYLDEPNGIIFKLTPIILFLLTSSIFTYFRYFLIKSVIFSNFFLIYFSWCLIAFILNLFTVIGLKINSKDMLSIWCSISLCVTYLIYFYYLFNNFSKYCYNTISIPIVGVWASIGILVGSDENVPPTAYENIWPLCTTSIICIFQLIMCIKYYI